LKAIILAAGQGTRLRPLTENKPKCMVEFQGKPIIDHLIETFRLCGIDDIVVINGYQGDMLESHLEGHNIRFVRNEAYDTTNMVYSLFCATDEFDDDLIISYSDIIYSPKILRQLMANPAPMSVAIDLNWKQLWDIRMEGILSDAETLKISPQGHIYEIGLKPESLEEIEGQYIGLISVRSESLAAMKAVYDDLDARQINGRSRPNIFMTDLLQEVINSGMNISADTFNGGWIEIDSLTDLSMYNEHITTLPGWKWQHLLEPICQLAMDAGEEIMTYYGDVQVEFRKEDESPLTKADLAANCVILEGLQTFKDQYPIISEENIKPSDWIDRTEWDTYWIVDPLDGTKEFLKNGDDFTVNIALIHNNFPVLGVIFAPAHELLYFASENWGSFRLDLKHRQKKSLCVSEPLGALTVLISSSHPTAELQNYLKNLPVHKCIPMGSSLKICKIADGEADIYPRLGPLSEWDIAAANVILTEAGGYLLDYHGNSISYDSANGRIQSFAAAATESIASFPNSIKKTIKLRLKGQVV